MTPDKKRNYDADGTWEPVPGWVEAAVMIVGILFAIGIPAFGYFIGQLIARVL